MRDDFSLRQIKPMPLKPMPLKSRPLKPRKSFFIFVGLIFLVTSCSKAQVPYSFELPKKLREVSGLAYGPDERVFALNDEKGIVYEIDMVAAEITPVLKIRNVDGKIVRADFEGLAFLGNEFYLVTSKGKLYRSKLTPGQENNTPLEDITDTGLSKVCEIEGLSSHEDFLYIVCKTNYLRQDKDYLLIFEYDPETAQTSPYLRVAYADLNRKVLNPSGIAVTENEIFIVSAIQGVLTRLDRKGNFIRDLELDKKRHRQTEGILVHDSGAIVLADEGKKKHGKITVYTPVSVRAPILDRR